MKGIYRLKILSLWEYEKYTYIVYKYPEFLLSWNNHHFLIYFYIYRKLRPPKPRKLNNFKFEANNDLKVTFSTNNKN